MIIKPKMNKSFPAMCRYALQEKNPEKKAEVLVAHGVRTDSAAHMAEDFNTIRSMRPGLGKAVLHVVLSFPKEEAGRLTNETLNQVVQDYLKEMKIKAANTQWAVIRHHDKAHPHLHLIVNRVDLNGQTVSDKFCRLRSLEASKQLEKKYGLLEADGIGRKHAREIGPTPAQAKATTPREVRAADWKRARHDIGRVLDYTRPLARNFTELGNALRPHGIELELTRRKDGSPMGVVFVLDGHRVKGSQLSKECGAGRLEAGFAKARQLGKALDPDKSLQKLAEEYELAKLLSGYAHAKNQPRAVSPEINPTKSRGFGIGN